jgi:hypothetical protein
MFATCNILEDQEKRSIFSVLFKLNLNATKSVGYVSNVQNEAAKEMIFLFE